MIGRKAFHFSACNLGVILTYNIIMACNIGAANLNLGECFALNESQTVPDVYTDPSVIVNIIVRTLFIGAGLVLFFLILYGGWQFISGSVKGKEKAQEVWGAAAIGFVVMFAAFWIVQIIKVVTGAEILL
jgi:hypothetical protein